MDKKRFDELGLSDGLLRAVSNMGYEEATPIQSATIPLLLEGVDMVGQSQTGSGKTAAFMLPALERVDAGLDHTQVLVLCPTRELAVQVAEETAKLARGKPGVRELPVYGGQSYERQFRGLKRGAHVVIGTPGRVLDHINKGSLRLDHLQTIILDEADRMLDMGFTEEINAILAAMPETRQTVLFSATVPQAIKKIIKKHTRDPEWIKIEAEELTAPEIEQLWYEVDRRSKLEVLCRIIDYEDVQYGIIFCATKMMVDDLTEHLNARGYPADRLHGDLTQQMRERVLGRFRKKQIDFLVATDVAARGLDVKDIEVVYNYDLPNDGEDYVHRIGRTGRAGSKGKAVTLVAGRELYKLERIMKFTNARIKRGKIPTVGELMAQRAEVFYGDLLKVLESGDFPVEVDWLDRLLEQGYSPSDVISALVSLVEKASGKAVPEEIPDPKTAKKNKKKDKYDKGKKDGKPFKNKKDGKPFKGKGNGEGNHPDIGPTRKITLSVGREQRIRPGDVLGVILGAAGIERHQVGYIKLHDRETDVDVEAVVAEKVVQKLQNIQFKGYRLQVR